MRLFLPCHGSIAGITYRAGATGAQVTAESGRTRSWLLANNGVDFLFDLAKNAGLNTETEAELAAQPVLRINALGRTGSSRNHLPLYWLNLGTRHRRSDTNRL